MVSHGVPARADIDPRALKHHLPDLFILERLDRAVFAFRLAGTRMCARYGRELRDHDFIRLWPTEDRGDVLVRLNDALQQGEPITVRGETRTLDGVATKFELLLLPLAESDGVATRLLGAMLTENDEALRAGEIIADQRLDRASEVVTPTGARAASVVFARARETSVSFLRIVDPAPEDDFARA